MRKGKPWEEPPAAKVNKQRKHSAVMLRQPPDCRLQLLLTAGIIFRV